MATHKVLLFHPLQLSKLAALVADYFGSDNVENEENFLAALKVESYKVIVLDLVSQDLDLNFCARLLEKPEIKNIPLVLLTQSGSLQDKLKALEIGCDDFIESAVSGDETCARITRSIFHRIATEQIASRLEMATQAARSVMVDNSDLGANLQFLLSVHDCDNFDQLGQQFFSVIERYGLKCSLQMRSIIGDKNMEAHGMAKDLEAQLLAQMAESGRYIDFGKRTICNYDRVSLLIKNMPVEEPEKYGAIKDNTFCLVQGLNARIYALEAQHRLQMEKDALTKLSQDVKNVMHSLKDSYQEVMRAILNQVENTSNAIHDRIPALTLLDYDEAFLENALVECIQETNRIFNEGLVVDEVFEKLEATVEKTLDAVNLPNPDQIAKSNRPKGGSSGSLVELF
jgi:CheY-like chemotaxis protein